MYQKDLSQTLPRVQLVFNFRKSNLRIIEHKVEKTVMRDYANYKTAAQKEAE